MTSRDEKIILTDIDGCVLDWEYSFHIWMEKQNEILETKDTYYVSEQYGMHKNEAMKAVRLFNESAAIGFLPPLRDAQYYMKLLHEKHQYRFIAVTSMSDDEYAKKLRVKNLAKLFGPNTFKEVHCLPCSGGKREILTELAQKYRGCPWIEDKPENAVDGTAVGLDSYLMLHSYNNTFREIGIRRVANWEEIYKHLNTLF
jgi:hypothetical protein